MLNRIGRNAPFVVPAVRTTPRRFHWRDHEGGHSRPRAVGGAHVLHHRRLPPLLRPPHVQDGRVCRSSSWPSAARTAAQKGPLWWAGNHRDHHRYADTDRDPHSPQQGFWWSHIGWILSRQVRRDRVRQDPRLRQVPRAALARQARLDRRRGRSRVGLLPDRRLGGPGVGLLRVDGAAVARARSSVNSRRPHLRPPPLRHRRHEPQLAARRAAHAGRGLAQQPPPLPGARRDRASSGGRST